MDMTWLESVAHHVNTLNNEESVVCRVLRVVTTTRLNGINSAPGEDRHEVLLADLYYSPGWLVGRAYEAVPRDKWAPVQHNWAPIQTEFRQIAVNESHIVSAEVLVPYREEQEEQ